MTTMKQGAMAQVLFVAVDKTDFASIESGVTSDFSVVLRTVKQGVSDASSEVTPSKVPSVVRSGIFKQTIEAAEISGVDDALLVISHASCATQIIPLSFQLQDVSNTLSAVLVDTDETTSSLSVMASQVSDILVDTTGLNGLDVSDIASAVWAEKYNVSSGVASSIGSFVTQQVQGLSDVTDTMTSTLSGLSDTLSNILDDTADISNYLSTMSNVLSDVSSRIPAALVAGRMDADMGAISTSTDAADKLEVSAETMNRVTVSDAGATISSFKTNETEATDDHWNGRVIIFTTGALTGQATTISDYTAATSLFQVVNLTEAPANGDSFVIV